MKLSALLVLFIFATPAFAQDDAHVARTHQLVGTIGTLPVRIELSRDGTKLSGTYFYEGSKTTLRTVVDVLFLDGTVDAAGRFELKETSTDVADNEVATGVFKGTLVERDAVFGISGTWSKPDGSKPLPISAAELRATTGGLRIVDATYAEKRAFYKKIVTAHYPQFEGSSPGVSKLNAAIEASVRRIVADYESNVDDLQTDDPEPVERFALEIDYAVTLATDSLVSVELTVYNDFGGAHPSAFAESLNFDVRSGRPIALADLFKRGSRPLAVLAAKAAPLFRGDFEGTADTSPTTENYGVWYLTPRGLTVVFAIPHVTGDTAEVYFPFAELTTVLDPTGPLAGVLK